MPETTASQLKELLQLPQPLSEWSRLQEEALLAAGGTSLRQALPIAAKDSARSLSERLRSVQLLAPGFANLEESWLLTLATDDHPEIRAQAAWLLGLRGDDFAWRTVLRLSEDRDDLVRRCAVESLGRARSPQVITALVARLKDSSRLTRFIAMNALSHHPVESWLDLALAQEARQPRLQALVALRTRGDSGASPRVTSVLRSMLDAGTPSPEEQLDLLRVLTLYEKTVVADPELQKAVERYLLAGFPSTNPDVRWEQARLIGLFRLESAFGPLWGELSRESDGRTQFHLAQALARLPRGWTQQDEAAATDWFVATQRGWFTELGTKGVEFPQHWATTLQAFVSHHPDAWRQRGKTIDLTSVPGGALISLLIRHESALAELSALYELQTTMTAKARVAAAFGRATGPGSGEWLRNQLKSETNATLRRTLVRSLAAQPVDPANVPHLTAGLRDAERDDVLPLAAALGRHRPALTRELARTCLHHMAASTRLVTGLERLLVMVSGRQRSGYQADRDPVSPGAGIR